MSFLQASEWTFTTPYQNPESYNPEPSYRKASYDVSNLSTRKDSTESIDFKFRYKTEVCKYWQNGQHCPFQNFCSFAHGPVEKRCRQGLPSKYKTKVCKNWLKTAHCTYGERCQFLHPQDNTEWAFRHQKHLNLLRQNLQLSFEYARRLPLFREITDVGAMKELLGEGYEPESALHKHSRPFFNGKPRFNSI